MDAAGANLFYTHLLETLMEGVEAAAYVGIGVVDGVETHHLVFREGDVDWQIWIQTGEKPVPMKYVITTKWMTGAPQYSVRMHNWNLNLDVGGEIFQFTPPPGSTNIETISINELGEITLGEQR